MLNTPVKKCYVLLFFALFAIYISIMVYFCWIKEEEVGSFDLKPTAMVNQRFDSVRPTIHVSVEAPPPVTLFMRMTAWMLFTVKRFYCDFLRTAVLFWPASYGKLVLVFNQESSLDHELANILERQFHQFFPDRKLEILYEPLPMNYETLLKLP
jgi:hypothetical protein